MKHTIAVLVENHFGVLAHVAGLFSARGFNIDSLAVGETDDPTVSRMTIVAHGDDRVIEQIMKQLGKLIDVLTVDDLTERQAIERELVLVKVTATAGTRAEMMQIVNTFRAKIVDVGQEYAIPVLELADAGKEALEDQRDIPLQPVRTPPILNESARITLQAFQKLRSVAAVAELRGLAENTVWDHLLIAVRLGLIASTDVVEPQKIKLILETNARLKPKGLKELKQSLPEDIGYDEIRCVLSDKP